MWICTVEGFPTATFPSNVDASTPGGDGPVRCKQVSYLELAKTGYRFARAIKIVLEGIEAL